MKKIINSLCLVLLIIPFIVNAEELCTVTKGTGNDIGDEIKCGTESFYIIDNEGDELALFAKYNLMVGDKISYIEVNETFEHLYYYDSDEYLYGVCEEKAKDAGLNPYYIHPIYEEYNHSYEDYMTYYDYDLIGCRVYEQIKSDHVVQDEKANGTKIVDGKSVLPGYGITYMNPQMGYEYFEKEIEYSNVYDENGDLIIEDTVFYKYIVKYEKELRNQNIDVLDVSFLTNKRLIKLLEKISNKKFVIDLEYPEDRYEDFEDPLLSSGKMDIKKYVGEEFKWLYDSTYWVGSGFEADDDSEYEDPYNDYYISNEGYLCALGREGCTYIAYPIGSGFRPVVTIAKEMVLSADKIKKEPIVNPETKDVIIIATIIFVLSLSISLIAYSKRKIAKI